MSKHEEMARVFRALHAGDAFIIPNPWDVGSAKLLAGLGFRALATTSAGYAFSVGRRDNGIGRAGMMAHVSAIASATELPVSADLENGYGDSPERVAETIRLAAAAGAVGGSIEDFTGRPDDPIYEFDASVERMRAAASAARSLPFPFTLTGRAENYMVGRSDLKDTIRRLQAYEDAGADVLYAPGVNRLEDIAEVLRSVGRPLNVVAGFESHGPDFATLSSLGVKRISVGSALARAAYGSLLRAGREMVQGGTFSFADDAVSYRDISDMMPGDAQDGV